MQQDLKSPLQPFLVSSCNPPPHKLKTAMTETKRTLKIQDFTGKFLKIHDLDCKPFICYLVIAPLQQTHVEHVARCNGYLYKFYRFVIIAQEIEKG